MNVFWISFRISERGNYQERYNGLIEAIEQASIRHWAETTSFVLIESSYTIDKLASTLKAPINTAHDLVLIGNPNVKQARVIGTVEDDDLFDLMPFTKRA